MSFYCCLPVEEKCLEKCLTRKIIEKSYKNNKFKISAPTWNEKFKLPDGSYSISDIQDYFECILKKLGEKTVNSSIKWCINNIEIRITFKIKEGYYLEFLTPGTMKLLGSINSKINKDENGENVPYLEITEGCNVNNSYLQNSRVLYIFMSKNCLYFCINLSINY